MHEIAKGIHPYVVSDIIWYHQQCDELDDALAEILSADYDHTDHCEYDDM